MAPVDPPDPPIVAEWKCPHDEDHIMGLVILRGQYRRLLLFTHAVTPGEYDPDVIGEVTGLMHVRCSICGEMRVWSEDVKKVRDTLRVSVCPG